MAKEDIILIGFPTALGVFAFLGFLFWLIRGIRREGWRFFLKREQQEEGDAQRSPV